eukprot:1160617-Pelagomonas_calceolata.AAC.3
MEKKGLTARKSNNSVTVTQGEMHLGFSTAIPKPLNVSFKTDYAQGAAGGMALLQQVQTHLLENFTSIVLTVWVRRKQATTKAGMTKAGKKSSGGSKGKAAAGPRAPAQQVSTAAGRLCSASCIHMSNVHDILYPTIHQDRQIELARSFFSGAAIFAARTLSVLAYISSKTLDAPVPTSSA